jgi:8-oxo-dGTP diphosphatase
MTHEVHLRTLCFIRDGGRVLLIRRTHPPNAGMFNAIGGKIEPEEDPYEACLREVEEETGLRLQEVTLRAIVTVLVEETRDRWILFTYTAERPKDQEVLDSSPEGPLQWIPLEEIPRLPVPPDIPLLLPHLYKEGIVYAKVVYAREGDSTPVSVTVSSPARRP